MDKLEVIKKCVICKQDKSTIEFSKSKREKDGLSRDCKKCNYVRAKKWHEEHPERVAEHKRNHYLNNLERYKQITARWNFEHKEKHMESHRKWLKNNPEKARAVRTRYENKRRAWENNCEDKVTTNELNELIKNSNNICFWCDKEIPQNKLHLDHIYPLSRGGMNNIYNIVISCEYCNKRKADKNPEKFIEEILIGQN